MQHSVKQQAFRGELRDHESMARHCSWRAGGEADLYYEPVDKQDLADFIGTLDPELPITWVGLGSNLLVRDGGLRGVAIVVLKRLNELSFTEDGRVYAEAGVTCARLARFCQRAGLSGADFLAGIPGTVGGALAMNAGAFGFETWQFVEAVEMMDRSGQITQRDRAQFEIGYRSVSHDPDEWFSAGWLRFPERNQAEESRIRELLHQRNTTQPIGQPSCGSVFKNPKDDYAARLIEACGLKGHCLGQACVSDKHANFIINTGNALANDIEDLIEFVRASVAAKFSIHLQHEVRIVGDR